MNKLIFLGTGAASSLSRQMTSLCFVGGKNAFLIDCGDGTGTLRQLVRAGISISSVNDVFITHKHRDHIMGVPSLLFHNIIIGKSEQIRIYGPKQAVDVLAPMIFETHTYDNAKKDRVLLEPLWSHQTVRVFRNPRTTVTALLLTNQDPEIECMAYRIQIGATTIVFSGDMKPNPVFEHGSRKSHIVIHECYGVSIDEDLAHRHNHSTARDAGVAAQKARAKQLILTHIPPYAKENDLIEEAKTYFDGEVIVATDLLTVEL